VRNVREANSLRRCNQTCLCSLVQVIGSYELFCYLFCVFTQRLIILCLIILFNRCLTNAAGLQAVVWHSSFINIFQDVARAESCVE
jgi:hypothetical protein